MRAEDQKLGTVWKGGGYAEKGHHPTKWRGQEAPWGLSSRLVTPNPMHGAGMGPIQFFHIAELMKIKPTGPTVTPRCQETSSILCECWL